MNLQQHSTKYHKNDEINLHCKILSVIILNCWNDSLDEFQENYKVHVDTKLSTTLHDGLNNLFHYFSMPVRKDFHDIIL